MGNNTIVWTWGGASALVLAACGGSVSVEPGGSGGAGGGGAGTGNVGNGTSTGGTGNAGTGGFPSTSSGVGNTGNDTSSTGGVGNSTASGGASTVNCEDTCGTIWDCGAANNFALCPGFASIGESEFIDGCIPGCEANPALAAIVDGNDCVGTLAILIDVNPDFDFACQVGNPPG